MNIREKVVQILRYCSFYQGNAYMIDERGDEAFHIVLPEEAELLENMGKLDFILLTGEAGDGKTRLLRSLEEKLKENAFSIYSDFSAESKDAKNKIIEKISKIIEGTSREKIIVAANVGIFTQTASLAQGNILEKLVQKKDFIRIINFERRNLANEKEVFKEIIQKFLDYDEKEICPNLGCPWHKNCVYRNNLNFLRSNEGIESVRTLCNAVFLLGEHITFRELLSLLSYMVTFGEECENRMKQENQKKFSYENVFCTTEDKLFQKISCLDPAKKRSKEDIIYDTIEICKAAKRKAFFNCSGDKYDLLNVEYLKEFREAIQIFQNTSYIDINTIQKGPLYRVKRGLLRLSKRGQSDMSMMVADTPTILGDDIQTEFELDNLEVVFNRLNLNFNYSEEGNIKMNNKFCISYVYRKPNNRELESITMQVDYKLFHYILMADDFYYLNHTTQSMEEVINTFFRKILKVRKGAYQKMRVEFNGEQHRGRRNFSLSLQKGNSILFENKKYIKIKNEL